MFAINGVVWEIRFVNPDSQYLKRSDGSTTVGMTDRNTYTVYLSNALDGEFLRKVLCHELVHCAIWSYGVDISEREEEFLADFIATYGRNVITLTDDIFRTLKIRTIS